MSRLRRSRPHPRRPRTVGAVLVEFALVSTVFFTILLGIIEVGMAFWVDETMQFAVREAVRCAVTGQLNCPGTSGGAQKDQYSAVLASLRSNSMGLYSLVTTDGDVHAYTVNADGSYSDLSPKTSGAFGIGGQIIVVQVDCRWKAISPLFYMAFPNGEFDFRVGATMKNEAF